MKHTFIGIFSLFVTVTFIAHRSFSEEYVPGALYVKFQSEYLNKNAPGISADELLARFGAVNVQQAFRIPDNTGMKKISFSAVERLESLELIKLVLFPLTSDMEYIARKISTHTDIEYAEPVYIQKLFDLPNDPFYSGAEPRQEYLNFISAPSAWNITHGDASVVIAIVDSGTNWMHPDLRDNVWTNPGEISGNRIDDDGNGFVDDVHGWDFFGKEDFLGNIDGDNNPISTANPHGTHVAGIAAAVTDNEIGIASLSRKVRFMPVKVGADRGEYLVFGYQGIYYAALNGADIVNCSWGSPQYSRTGEEIVKFASTMGAVIVASAGNDDTDMFNYPAAYPSVIGVGSVDIDGTKSSFSNYGPYVDISAPGSMIFSTLPDGSYGYMSGTSMSAPIVSALAALIKSAHIDWDHDRIRAQIVGTASPVSAGDPYRYLCGCGYINAEKALGNPVLHLDVTAYKFSDKRGNDDSLFTPGEEIEAKITVRNYGDSIDNVSINVTSITGFLTPQQTRLNIGSIDHRGEITVPDIPFIVGQDISLDAKDFVRLDFESSDGSINFATIDVVVNTSYATFTANTIEMSVDGMGHIGYVDFPENTKGSPLIVRRISHSDSSVFNVPLLFEGGLLVGNVENRISDSIRGINQSIPESDFTLRIPFLFERAPDGSVQKGKVVFTDDGAGSGRYNLSVTLETYAYNEAGHDQYIILAYKFINEGNKTLSGLRAGLFLDFDVPESQGYDDYGFYSSEDDILVVTENVKEKNNKIMLGATISESIYTPWLIDNTSTEEYYFGIYDGFTDEEKWRSLSSGRVENGTVGPGDISLVLSPESFTLKPGEQKQVIFILAYGLGYDELKKQIYNARSRTGQIAVSTGEENDELAPDQFSIKSIYPNPFNPVTTVSFYLPEDAGISVDIFDILGRHVHTVFQGFKARGDNNLLIDGKTFASGLYFVRIETDSGLKASRKIIMLK
ncbi:S8 family serine peptidase [Candidatus Latescibacterota bacterium]